MSGSEVVAMSNDWPAWVQAIGSVLAILTAIGLHAYSERQRKSRAEAVYFSMMSRVGDEARHCIGAMELSHAERGNLSVSALDLDQAIADLRAFGVSVELDETRIELALDLIKISRNVSAEVKHWSSITSRREPVSSSSIEKSRLWAAAVSDVERKIVALAGAV